MYDCCNIMHIIAVFIQYCGGVIYKHDALPVSIHRNA